MATDWQRQQAQAERARAREERQREAARKAAEKAAHERYVAEREAEAAKQTEQVQARVEALRTVLSSGLARPPAPGVAAKRPFTEPPLDLGSLAEPAPQPALEDYMPRTPGLVGALFGGWRRYERAKPQSEQRLAEAKQAWEVAEAERQQKVAVARQAHAQRVAQQRDEVEQHNRRVEATERKIQDRDRDTVEACARRVVARMPRPQGFPETAEVIYSGPPQEQVLIKFELPPAEVVPGTRTFKYVKKSDEITQSARPKKETDELYRSVIAQLALLCLRDVLTADPVLQKVGFNGHVQATNPATGQEEYPCLISVLVDRDEFDDLVLDRVDPAVCLKSLQAIVSQHPYALEGIQPILDFDLTKYNFVDGLDAVSSLDSRPNLLDLSPENFEHLIRQVFEANPEFKGWTTTRSNDDGVDGVVTNDTALVGGLAVIQAKRYKKPIGPNHIRELVGTMDEKRAGKGILVTTSYFTSGAETKAKENGRIELIDGPRLKHLISANLGKDVIIGVDFPDRVRNQQT